MAQSFIKILIRMLLNECAFVDMKNERRNVFRILNRGQMRWATHTLALILYRHIQNMSWAAVQNLWWCASTVTNNNNNNKKLSETHRDLEINVLDVPNYGLPNVLIKIFACILPAVNALRCPCPPNTHIRSMLGGMAQASNVFIHCFMKRCACVTFLANIVRAIVNEIE